MIVVLGLAACGGGSEDSAADNTASESTTSLAAEPAEATESTEPVSDTSGEEPSDNSADTSDSGQAPGPCSEVFTVAEVEAALGTTVEFSGGDSNCTMTFPADEAGDRVGTAGAGTNEQYAESFDSSLERYNNGSNPGGEGVLLPGGAGFANVGGFAIRSDSGTYYLVGLPDNVADLAGVEALANLLLAR
mgnify:CR=1 FL=1